MESLRDKVAIVTGASSGIGAATARAMAVRGMYVVAVARRLPALQALAGELGEDRVLPLRVDVTSGPDVQGMIAATIARFGRIDVLFANAGVFKQGQVADVDLDALLAIVDTNFTGVIRCIKAVLPPMIAQRSGDILVTSSISAHRAIDNEAVYSASKHAVATLLAILRREVAPSGIRVGSVSPAIVLNDIWGITAAEDIAAGLAAHAGLASEDVAELVLYMLGMPRRITIHDLVAIAQAQII